MSEIYCYFMLKPSYVYFCFKITLEHPAFLFLYDLGWCTVDCTHVCVQFVQFVHSVSCRAYTVDCRVSSRSAMPAFSGTPLWVVEDDSCSSYWKFGVEVTVFLHCGEQAKATCLHYAACNGRSEVVDVLLESTAPVSPHQCAVYVFRE